MLFPPIEDPRYGQIAVQLVQVAQAADLQGAFDLLSEFSSAERQIIGDKAVSLGADRTTIDNLIKIVDGETIEVIGKAPSWHWLVVATALSTAGLGLLAYRKYGRR